MKTAPLKIRKAISATKLAGVDDNTLDRLTEVFKSLSDRQHLLILMLLAKEREMHVSAICQTLGQSQPAVSHHLTQLKSAGLVNSRRQGKFNFYSVDSGLASNVLSKFFPQSSSVQQKMIFGELELTFRVK